MPKTATLAFILSSKSGLEARCTKCAHCRELDVLALAVEFGETATLDQIERRLGRCSACGSPAYLDVIAKYLPPVT